MAILVILVVGIAAELKILVALRNTDPGLVILGQDIIFLDGGAAGRNQEKSSINTASPNFPHHAKNIHKLTYLHRIGAKHDHGFGAILARNKISFLGEPRIHQRIGAPLHRRLGDGFHLIF